MLMIGYIPSSTNLHLKKDILGTSDKILLLLKFIATVSEVFDCRVSREAE
jgi:hypothetical protein